VVDRGKEFKTLPIGFVKLLCSMRCRLEVRGRLGGGGDKTLTSISQAVIARVRELAMRQLVHSGETVGSDVAGCIVAVGQKSQPLRPAALLEPLKYGLGYLSSILVLQLGRCHVVHSQDPSPTLSEDKDCHTCPLRLKRGLHSEIRSLTVPLL